MKESNNPEALNEVSTHNSYNISSTTFNIQLKFTSHAKQKNMTNDQEKTKQKQSVETDSKTNQMLELAAMDFRAVTINTYKDVKENDYSK